MKSYICLILVFTFVSCTQSNNSSVSTSDSDSLQNKGNNIADLYDTVGGKGVFFTNLSDSQEVKSPFIVKMGIVGMDVIAAGDIKELTGHHHIIIDGQPIESGQGVPLDETHLHYGKAQTEADIKLEPGFHTLTLQFANGVHASFGPRWSRTITVRAK